MQSGIARRPKQTRSAIITIEVPEESKKPEEEIVKDNDVDIDNVKRFDERMLAFNER